MFVLRVFSLVTGVIIVIADFGADYSSYSSIFGHNPYWQFTGGSQGILNTGLSSYPSHYGLQLSGSSQPLYGETFAGSSGLHNVARYYGGHNIINNGISSRPFSPYSIYFNFDDDHELGRLTNPYLFQNQRRAQPSGVLSHPSVPGLRGHNQNQHGARSNGLLLHSSVSGLRGHYQNPERAQSSGVLSHSSKPGLRRHNHTPHRAQNPHRAQPSGSSYARSARNQNIKRRLTSKPSLNSDDDDDEEEDESRSFLIGSQPSGFSSHSDFGGRQTAVKDTFSQFSGRSSFHSSPGGFNGHQNIPTHQDLKKLQGTTSLASSRSYNMQSAPSGLTKQLGSSMAGSFGSRHIQNRVSLDDDREDYNVFAGLQTFQRFPDSSSNLLSQPTTHLQRTSAGYLTGHRASLFPTKPKQNVLVHKHHTMLHYPVLPLYFNPYLFDEIYEIHNY